MNTKKQLDHYWYYYKWHFIVGLLVVLALVYTLYSCAMIVQPDLVVTYVGTLPLETDNMRAFEQEYAKYITDINGDDKQVISMQKIEFAPKTTGAVVDGQVEMALQMRLMAELAAGDTTLYLFSADLLDFFKEQEALEPLDAIGIAGDYLKLEGNQVLRNLNLVGENYLAAIRVRPNKMKENEQKHYENAFQLLEAMK